MKRNVVAMLLIGALACTDSNAPAPAVHQFDILPAGATVAAGVSVTFVAQRQDSTVDAWRVSDSSAARIASYGNGWALVQTLAAGTVTITATRMGDTGQATLVILPPPPPPPDTARSGLTISPALDTVTVGQVVTFLPPDDGYPPETYQWSVSDTGLAQVQRPSWYEGTVVARAAGTVTVTATLGEATGRATLVIREAKPGEWESIDLSLIDRQATAALGINDDGTIVGQYGNNTGRGFVYKDGTIRLLPSSGLGDDPQAIGPSGTIAGIIYEHPAAPHQTVLEVWATPDAAPRALFGETYDHPRIVGINERGDVLVTINRETGRDSMYNRAVLWRDGVRIGLGHLADTTMDHPWTFANALNAKGQIVGTSEVRRIPPVGNYPHRVFHPFIWDNGVMRDLGVLTPLPCWDGMPGDCAWGEAVAINNHGVVVGNVNDPVASKTRAFIWEKGVMRDLGVLPGHTTRALAINDRGQVLGYVEGVGAFLWENGQVQMINNPGVGYAIPVLGVNGEVLVIGAGPTNGSQPHLFVWQAGQMSDLGESNAYAINSRGEIVGTSAGRAMLWRKKQSP